MSEQIQDQRLLGGSWNILPPGDKIPEGDSLAIRNFRVDQAGVLRVTAPPVPIRAMSPVSNKAIASIIPAPTYGSTSAFVFDGTDGWLIDFIAPNASVHFVLSSNWEGTQYVANPIGYVPWLRSSYLLNPWIAKKIGFALNTSPFTCDWMPPVPTSAPTASVTPGAGSIAAGDYTYYVTFAGNNGNNQGDPIIEANPGSSSVSVTIASDGSSVTLSNLPTWDGSGYIFPHRRIYRAGGVLGAPYRVADIQDLTTTTFTDTIDNTSLLETGIQMDTDNDQPPHARILVGPYFGRLLAANSITFPNRFWWTKIQSPAFPGSESGDFFDPNQPFLSVPASQPGNWADIGDDYRTINAVTVHSRIVVFYLDDEIWRLSGDPDTGTLERTSSGIGIPLFGQNLVANAGAYDYFWSTDGIFRFNLDQPQKITEKIEPLFFGRLPITGNDLNTILQVATPVKLQYLNGMLFFSYVDTAGQFNAVVYHEESQRFAQLSTTSGITEIAKGASQNTYTCGFSNGEIGAPDQTSLSVPVTYQTRFLDQQHSDTPKTYTEIVIDHELLGAACNVQTVYNNGDGTVAVEEFAISSTSRTKTRFALGQPGINGAVATNISILLYGNLPVGAAIHALYIYYTLGSRVTTTQISRAWKFGQSEEIYEAKELALDCQFKGPATLYLEGDVANVNNIGLQQTISLQPYSYRRNYQLPLNPHIDARLFKMTLDCPAMMGVYSARMLVRKYGVYIEDYEAAAGYVWEHAPLDFGMVDDKVFDQIQLEMDANGLVSPQIFTDQPADSIRLFETFPIQATAGRRWYTLELTSPQIHGKLFQLKIPSVVGYKLYRGRVRFRRVGRYFSNNANDQLRTLEQDFGTERVKLVKKLEFDIQTNGPMTFQIYCDEPTNLARRLAFTIDTEGLRKVVRIDLPGNTRGRIWRIDGSTASWGRLFKIRAWMRVTGENTSDPWRWEDFAVENSEVLPTWGQLPIPPTADTFDWMPVTVPFGQEQGL